MKTAEFALIVAAARKEVEKALASRDRSAIEAFAPAFAVKDGRLFMSSGGSTVDLGNVIGPRGVDGTDGIDGKTIKGDKGESGLSIRGEKGDKGDPGPKGDDGDPGEDGKDGVGVANAYVSEAGYLIIELTTGRKITAGHVKGRDGKNGEASVIYGGGAGSSGGGGAGTDLAYDEATRILSSSTGDDVTLPLVVASGDAGLMTGADKAKLDGIEALADVTDAANVAAAGAVMESDYTPAHSLLVQQSGTGSPSSLSVGNDTILGRMSGGGSAIAALTGAQATTLLDVATTTLKGLAPARSGVATEYLDGSGVYSTPAGGAGTNLTYTAATRVIASDTGTDATLPLMSSGDAGLVPASGGGTANFLRADGTFAAPAGGGASLITAAPATDQADWNPAGFGAGVGYIKLQPTTNSFVTGIVAGATDQFVTLFNDSDFVVCIEGESGASTAANRFKKRALTMWLLPQESMGFRYSDTAARWVLVNDSKQIGDANDRSQIFVPNTTTTIASIGGPLSTLTATITTVAMTATPTNDFQEYNFTQVSNSTAAGTSSMRSVALNYARGPTAFRQGFFHSGMVRFTAKGATGAVRAGMLAAVAVSATLNTALTNCLLLGAETADTNLRIYSGSAAAGTPVDLGANFPCPSATAAYEYCFYAPSGSSFVRYMVRRLDTRFVAEGSLTSNIPVNTTALAHRLEVMVGATAVANTAQMAHLYTQGL